jgi:type I restriction enzyme S subunit
MKNCRLFDSELKVTVAGLDAGSRLAQTNSVLLLVRGSELHKRIPVGIAARPVAFNQDVKALMARDGLLPEYLLYWLLGAEPLLLAKVEHTGIGAGKLDTDVLKNLPISLPKEPEQRAIANVLGSLDDRIELNRQMNETLEALAQTLFKKWFMDAAATKPRSWSEVSIAELCEINSLTLGKNDELDRIEYVEISAVQRGSIATIQSYERGDEPSRARRRLRHGDTVLSTVRPDRGAYFLCLNPSPTLIASTGFAVLTPTKVPWSFAYAAMTQPEVFEYLGQHADGGAYPAVRPELIGKMTVPWPRQTELLESFHDVCAPLYERAEHNRLESRTLAELRDALLPKLLSGELRVPVANPQSKIPTRAQPY